MVLTGANGAGKTNLLEALSLLSPGRGLRGARLAEISRLRENGAEEPDAAVREWAVAAEFATPHGALSIGVGWAEADGERRAVHIDGQTARSQTALAEHISMVWLTPAMDRLFVGAPSGRRRFLDRLVFAFDPAHAANAAGCCARPGWTIPGLAPWNEICPSALWPSRRHALTWSSG